MKAFKVHVKISHHCHLGNVNFTLKSHCGLKCTCLDLGPIICQHSSFLGCKCLEASSLTTHSLTARHGVRSFNLCHVILPLFLKPRNEASEGWVQIRIMICLGKLGNWAFWSNIIKAIHLKKNPVENPSSSPPSSSHHSTRVFILNQSPKLLVSNLNYTKFGAVLGFLHLKIDSNEWQWLWLCVTFVCFYYLYLDSLNRPVLSFRCIFVYRSSLM